MNAEERGNALFKVTLYMLFFIFVVQLHEI